MTSPDHNTSFEALKALSWSTQQVITWNLDKWRRLSNTTPEYGPPSQRTLTLTSRTIGTHIHTEETVFRSLDPLPVAVDAARLIRAHVTKISLLLMNKPFTRSAIMSEVRGVRTQIQYFSPVMEISLLRDGCSRTLGNELGSRCRQIFLELVALLKALRVLTRWEELQDRSGKSLSSLPAPDVSDQQENGGSLDIRDNRTTMPKLAGAVWEACDSVIELQRLGLGGVLVFKAKQHRDTLNDALEELREWSQESDEGFSDQMDEVREQFGLSLSIDGQNEHTSHGKTEHSAEELKASVDLTLKKLRLVRTVEDAVIHHRLKAVSTTPLPPDAFEKYDTVIEMMDTLTTIADDMAIAYQEYDMTTGEEMRAKLCSTATKGTYSIWLTPNGNTDHFSNWHARWLVALEGEAVA